jgi:hypothetical protein
MNPGHRVPEAGHVEVPAFLSLVLRRRLCRSGLAGKRRTLPLASYLDYKPSSQGRLPMTSPEPGTGRLPALTAEDLAAIDRALEHAADTDENAERLAVETARDKVLDALYPAEPGQSH